MSEEDWRPTCGEVKNKVWVDVWDSEKNLSAKMIIIPPDKDATTSNILTVRNSKIIKLTKELWFALLLARARTTKENGWTTGENKKTAEFILEYIKEK